MAKNIMILFLSDIKLKGTKFNDRGKNILVGNVEPVEYDKIGPSKTTNESAVKYLLKKYPKVKLDKVYVIATKMIRNEDYDKEGNPKEWRFKDTSYTENPEKIWTHLEYFFDRIRSVVPDIDEIKEVCNYDEDAPIQDSMQAVVEVAKEVQKYINEAGKVVVHADFTGGMRHANLVMLDAIRLLQYDTRVSLGKILYSNFNSDPKKVEEANSVYGLVDLIAGAEEFVQFGSVNSLQQYYEEKEISDELGRVMKAMENFAEAIRLCHYGSFTKSITDLRSALKAFDVHMDSVEMQDDEKALNDKFMARLEGRIRESYGDILSENSDDLSLIKWCVENGYLQQALTLYVERVPEVIGENKILEVTQKGMPAFMEQFKKKNGENRSPYFYMVNVFKNKKSNDKATQTLDNLRSKIYTPLLKEICQKIKKRTLNREMDISGLINQIGENKFIGAEDKIYLSIDQKTLKKRIYLIEKIRADDMYLESKDTDLQEFLKVYRENVINADYIKKYKNDAYSAHDLEDNWQFVFGNLSTQKKQKVLLNYLCNGLQKDPATQIFSNIYFSFSKSIFDLIDIEFLETNIEKELLRNILNRYGVLKNERNHSNHARADASEFTAKTLGDEIRAGLTDLREAIQKVQ